MGPTDLLAMVKKQLLSDWLLCDTDKELTRYH